MTKHRMNAIVSELSMNDLNSKFFEYMQSESNADEAANFIYENLFEDVSLGFLFEYHHGMKTGLTELLEGEKEDEEPYKIVNSPECDVFGFSILKKTPDSNCSCPNCERPVSATRFAPHLEKCMGMGRNSSRIASRRIASNSREPASYAGLLSDDEDDVDWAGGSLQSERRKRRIKNNNNRKPSKMQNGNNRNNNGSQHTDPNDGGATYETMTANEKKNLLLQICGVVSEHTKKLCTRSTRCPQHTEEQRRALRNTVLEPSTPESSLAGDDAGSPIDSSPSSSCSSSSRKRDRHRKPKNKSKRERLSPARE